MKITVETNAQKKIRWLQSVLHEKPRLLQESEIEHIEKFGLCRNGELDDLLFTLRKCQEGGGK
jgi:hypothetical protein